MSLDTCTCARTAPAVNAEKGADTCALIMAGGSGERFGDSRGKQFVELCGLPMAAWSIAAYDRAPSVGRIVVVCARDKAEQMCDEVLGRLTLTTPVTLAPGGDTRQQSVLSGLSAIDEDFSLVAIHDAARPLTEVEDIEGILAYVRNTPEAEGAICAARSIDTLKQVDGTEITATLDRDVIWAAQTPQVFRLDTIRALHEKAAREGSLDATDDAALVERAGGRVDVYETSRDNIKVTLPGDLDIAQVILEHRIMGEGAPA